MSVYARVKTLEQLNLVLNDDSIDTVICSVNLLSAFHGKEKRKILELPAVLREKNKEAFELLVDADTLEDVDGVLVDNIDELGYLKKIDYKGLVVCGEFLYTYNSASMNFMKTQFSEVEFLAPCELSLKELHSLEEAAKENLIYKIYGHQALMITAQCFRRNYSGCSLHTQKPQAPYISFANMKNEAFLAAADCADCYDIVYNEEPLSMFDDLKEIEIENLLLDFTVETKEETRNVLECFNKGRTLKEKKNTGHYYKKID